MISLKSDKTLKPGDLKGVVGTYSHNRYAAMLNPVAGKKAEKYCFNMKLLFTQEHGEYCIQEARARSMGLLGKKWGPPPPSELTRRAESDQRPGQQGTGNIAKINFNDDGAKTSKGYTSTGRKSLLGGPEPTVTINTKEALADVYGMYNSPTRTMKGPGSKHAPVKKVEPITPMASLASPPPRPQVSDENAIARAKPLPGKLLLSSCYRLLPT